MTTADRSKAQLTRRSMLSLAAAVLLGGCSLGTTEDPDDPIAPLPDDQVVLSVSTSGGFFAPTFWALDSPSLVVYGSGLIVSSSDGSSRAEVPSRYVEGRVDPLAVARFIRDAERRELLSGDFGFPQVTDLGSDRIKLHGNSGVQDVSVYAFQTKFDDQLSWSQRRRRRRLRSLIERMSHLIGDTAQPYRPGRIVVLEQSTRPSSEPATFTWPGPDPSVFLHTSTTAGRQSTACGEITGEQARTVYQAAMANAGQRWLVQGRTRLLAVNPLPIEIDC